MASKQDQFEKIKKSLQAAEDRLSVIRKRLNELNEEMEQLLVLNEVKGRKNRAIGRARGEIEELRKEESLLEAKVAALKKSLPEIEREARIETAKKVTVKLCEKAHSELTELLKGTPSLDCLKAEVAKIKQYGDFLEDVKTRFLSTSKEIANLMTSEKLDRVGAVTMNNLRSDRNIDYSQVLQLSDSLIDLSKNINQLQYSLFYTCTNNPLEFYLPPEPKPEPVFSENGRFKIEKVGDRWEGFMKQTLFAGGVALESWRQILSKAAVDKITFQELEDIARSIREKEKQRVREKALQVYQ